MENHDSKRITCSKEEIKDTTSIETAMSSTRTSMKRQHQLETQETTLSMPTTSIHSRQLRHLEPQTNISLRHLETTNQHSAQTFINHTIYYSSFQMEQLPIDKDSRRLETRTLKIFKGIRSSLNKTLSIFLWYKTQS